MPGTRTQRNPEVEHLGRRVEGLEGRMGNIEVGQAQITERIDSNAQRSEDFRHQTRTDLGEVKAQGSQTQALIQDWIKEERARKDAAEAHARDIAAAEAKAKHDSATWYRSLVTPQVVAVLLAVVAALAGVQIPGIAHVLGLGVEAPVPTVPVSAEP